MSGSVRICVFHYSDLLVAAVVVVISVFGYFLDIFARELACAGSEMTDEDVVGLFPVALLSLSLSFGDLCFYNDGRAAVLPHFSIVFLFHFISALLFFCVCFVLFFVLFVFFLSLFYYLFLI